MRSEVFGPVGNDRYATYLSDIHDSAQLLLRLINDVLDLSKAEAGRLELQEECIDVAGLCRAVSHMVRHRVRSQDLKVAVEVPPDLPELYADRTRLQQILANLLTNAIKATPAGGLITIRARAGPAGSLTIEVEDNGVGMTEEEVALALQPFVQIQRRGRVAVEGTGLGLPLCDELIERHSGRLDLRSTPGKGTMAAVTFPPSRTVVARTDAPAPV